MNTDLFEIIHTTRSMRRLKPDPVPPGLIRQILEAGTAAPSGGNMQNWRFLVMRDPAIKVEVAQWYRRGWHEIVGPRYRAGGPAPGTSPERFNRMLAAAEHLADHLHEAPLWIVSPASRWRTSCSLIGGGGAGRKPDRGAQNSGFCQVSRQLGPGLVAGSATDRLRVG